MKRKDKKRMWQKFKDDGFTVGSYNFFPILDQFFDSDREVKDPLADDELTFTQMLNIFPEYREQLQLYQMCCDEKGRIVRNHDYYKKYKSKPHSSGKRGGTKVHRAYKAAEDQFKK